MAALAFVTGLAAALAGCGGGSPIINFAEGEGGRAGAGNEHFTGLHPNDFQIHGIDVSHWQGDIDWQAVAQSGVKFVWIKATEGGDHLDRKFRENWEGAASAGIPRGAYHFVYWCRDAREQAEWFIRNVPYDRHALPPVLDVEFTPFSRTCRRKLPRPAALRKMRIILEAMERHYRKRPVIYATVDFYKEMMHPDEFSDYPVWARSTKYDPSVPFPGRRWVFWQYQSDGRVPGIRGNVDKNVFHGNRAQWVRWLTDGR